MPTLNATSSVYDLINVTQGGDILQFVKGINDLTGQWFMLLVLIAGWIILFVSMRSPTVDNKDALASSSFIVAVMTIFFITLELVRVNIAVFIILIAMALFAFIALKRN